MRKTTYFEPVTDVYGIDHETLRRHVPSIFATERYEASTSAKFTPLPTVHVVDALAAAGFVPVMAMQANTRDFNAAGYCTHLLRFRHRDDLGRQAEVFEYVLKNANTGDSAYDLMLGFFRLICRNGLIFGEFEDYRVAHRGNIAANVVEGTLRLVQATLEQREKVEQWKSIDLPQPERLLLAEHIHRMRFGEDSNTLVTPQELLRPRRSEDRAIESTLAGTVNIVQENATQGGQVRYNRKTGQRVKTRGVNNITGSVSLNKAVTAFAEELRKIHS